MLFRSVSQSRYIRGGGIEQACSQIFLLEDPNMKAFYGKSWDELKHEPYVVFNEF